VPVYNLFLCGWHVASEIALPELCAWEDSASPIDVHLRLGQVPPFPGMEEQQKRLTINAAGDCRIMIPGIGNFGLHQGCEIVVEPLIDPQSVALRNYLFGTGLGMLCHQRGVLPLHGSCLQLGDKAVIFSGASGAGKSTLAAALVHRGHRLIADDVCVLTQTKEGWMVWPAFPRVKLKPSAHQAIFGTEPALETLGMQGKHHFRFDPAKSFAVQPVPLGTIYFLDKTETGEQDRIQEVSGLPRMALVHGQIFRRRMGARMGRREALFQAAAQIASTIAIRRLIRGYDLSRLDATMVMLEQAHDLKMPTAN